MRFTEGSMTYQIRENTAEVSVYASGTDISGSVTVPETVRGCTVTAIGERAFEYRHGLTEVILPSGVESIGKEAFCGSSELVSISIPDSVTWVGRDAFDNTAWYENQPDGVVYAGRAAYKCKGTCPSSVTIKDGTTEIAAKAFSRCVELRNISLPDSVTAIGQCAFAECTKLSDVYFAGSRELWDRIMIDKFANEELLRVLRCAGESQPSTEKTGDLNGDGTIDASECMKVRRAFFGLVTLSGDELKAIDFNGNGQVDATDCMKQKRMFFGLT